MSLTKFIMDVPGISLHGIFSAERKTHLPLLAVRWSDWYGRISNLIRHSQIWAHKVIL